MCVVNSIQSKTLRARLTTAIPEYHRLMDVLASAAGSKAIFCQEMEKMIILVGEHRLT